MTWLRTMQALAREASAAGRQTGEQFRTPTWWFLLSRLAGAPRLAKRRFRKPVWPLSTARRFCARPVCSPRYNPLF